MSKVSRDNKKKAVKSIAKKPESAEPTKSAKVQKPNYGKCCTCKSYTCYPGYCKSKNAYTARKNTCDGYKES